MQTFLWVILLLLPLIAGYVVYRADVRRAITYPWLTAALRGLVVLLTLLLLIAPLINIDRNETEKPIVLFLQDNSASVPLALKADTSSYGKDAATLLEKLEKEYRVVKWGFGNAIQKDTLFSYKQQGTDIGAALAQAIEFYGQQNLGAVILATDGRYNQGINPQFSDLPFNGSLYTVALGDSAQQRDLRIAQVYANRTVSLGSQFEIRADIIAQGCEGYNDNVRLTEAGGGAGQSTPLSIPANRFDRAVSFTLKADRAGLHHYIISAPAADGEQNIANNRRDVFVEVVNEKKNILIAAASPHPDIAAIREALSGLEGYTITVRTGDNLPASFADYNIIILHGLPAQGIAMQGLAASKKPVWFILGASSYMPFVNGAQNAARANVNPAAQQPVFAALNPSFTAFTLPQNMNAVLDKMPPLSVPVGQIQLGPNAIALMNARGNAQQPLWILQQGNTPMALLAGEGIWRWRLFEYRHFNTHATIDEAIRQTVSFLSVNVTEKPFTVSLPKYVWSDDEAIILNAYLLNANNEQVNTPEASIVIIDTAGRKTPYNFERSGNAYRLNIGLRAAGSYNYSAKVVYEGKAYTATGSFAVQHMPVELLETGADYPLLHAVANKYHGTLIPHRQVSSLYDSIKRNQAIKPVIQSHTESIPLVDWKWYFLFILLFAVTEWLLRKYWMAQ